jgi:predicted transcriptional regulator
LERMPENPHEELLVAIAGPAVNFVIAALTAVTIILVRGFDELMLIEQTGTDFLITTFYINLGMGTFNLLPAFPMDGGRILRALLVQKMGYVSATETAASVGQFLAILLGMLGLITNGMLVVVAVFIYLGAQQEALQVQMKSILKGIPVREAMRTHFTTLLRDNELAVALKELLAGNQHDFPVVDDNNALCGMVYREDILSNLDNEQDAVLIDKLMRPDCGAVSANAMLDEALAAMNERDCSVLPVIQSGNVVGLISLENIGAFMMIQSARKNHRRSASKGSRFTPFETHSVVAARKDSNSTSIF